MIGERVIVVDTTILGIDSNIVGIYANIGVAIGTFILAVGTIILGWYTYKSVQTSNATLEFLRTQVDIAKKDFENKQTELEKPQIIDQLQYVLNPLRNILEIEGRQINDRLDFWESFKTKESYLYRPEKDFHEFYDEPSTTTQLGSIISNIDSRNPNFSKICNERHKIILRIYDLFRELFDEIKKEGVIKKIDESIKKNSGYVCEPAGLDAYNEQQYNEAIKIDYFDPNDDPPFSSYYIDLGFYITTLFNVSVANFLTQRISPKSSDEPIIQDCSGGNNELNDFFCSLQINKYSERFKSLINGLKTVDNRLLTKIDEIRLFYQNKYHLTDEELWKINQFNKNANDSC